jgi:diadenosine tetraphosphatase ApaH/serine/threonine PP2A family protein phosphatase
MFAIISDIHSNIEALTTVFEDIEKRGIKKVYCLGDIIGYGPNPKECLDLVIEKTQSCVMGNHDYAILYEPTNFNLGAERASFWTRSQLETEPGSGKRHKRWEYLGTQQMRSTLSADLEGAKATFEFVHASPKRPINEYLFPDDVYATPTKITSQFDRIKHICFIGHTHLPGVFLGDPDFYTPEELDYVYPIIPEERAIINVGSVGQPRDKDNRASYVYVEKSTVNFVRLQYDYEATANKIRAVPELDNFEADRLSEGR